MTVTSPMAVLAGVLALATVLGLALRARTGRVTTLGAPTTDGRTGSGSTRTASTSPSAADIAPTEAYGARATLVQFFTPTCKRCCPSTARQLHALAARHGGVDLTPGTPSSPPLGVLDASECPPTFGTDASQVVGLIARGQVALAIAIEVTEDGEEAAVRVPDALGLTADDVIVGISASGRTPTRSQPSWRRGAGPPCRSPSGTLRRLQFGFATYHWTTSLDSSANLASDVRTDSVLGVTHRGTSDRLFIALLTEADLDHHDGSSRAKPLVV